MTSDPQQQDAEYLRLLSIFHYVVAGMMAVWGSFPIIHFVVGVVMLSGAFEPPKQGGPPLELFGALFALMAGLFITVGWTLAICTFFAGRNLVRRQHYLYCLIMAGVMAAACTASSLVRPWLSCWWFANSTIRIAFFAIRPTKVTSPT